MLYNKFYFQILIFLAFFKLENVTRRNKNCQFAFLKNLCLETESERNLNLESFLVKTANIFFRTKGLVFHCEESEFF